MFITHLQAIWGVYKICCEQIDSRVLVYTTFCSYWRELLPQIIITKPRTDLCWQCQQHSTLIVKAINKSAEEKSKVQIVYTIFKHVTFMLFKAIKSAEEHIGLVQKERAHYRECLDTSSTNFEASFPVVPQPGSCLPANSTDTAIHYSFDMAQQVHFKSNGTSKHTFIFYCSISKLHTFIIPSFHSMIRCTGSAK